MIGRDYYGVFPLRGKLLNVRDANHSTIMNNKEISELKQILGLQQGKDYTDPAARKSLRYGHLMIMTDQVALTLTLSVPLPTILPLPLTLNPHPHPHTAPHPDPRSRTRTTTARTSRG